jgi:nitronate monooxygenase/enoyl-[acyl-carrier protein] reductase II
MLHTTLCDLLDIDYPIIQAGMGSATSAALAAAVSNAGGLGSLGAFFRSADDFKGELGALRKLTNRSIALNHVIPSLEEETFTAALAARPKVLAFALADPVDYVQRAHDVGSLVMHQVTNVQQAEEAAERGVDIIVAQGGEAGGYGANVASLPLIPQVVDAVSPLPVVAAGGIFNGRGIAAALMLGAVGVNIGTRFLASQEAPNQGWKKPIEGAVSEDAVKVGFFNDILPVPGSVGYGTVIRAIKTPVIEEWEGKREEAREKPGEVLMTLVGKNQGNLPVSGQSAGGIDEILPAAEIVQRLVSETIEALRSAETFFGD